jgi:hypothetical protein
MNITASPEQKKAAALLAQLQPAPAAPGEPFAYVVLSNPTLETPWYGRTAFSAASREAVDKILAAFALCGFNIRFALWVNGRAFERVVWEEAT